MGEEQQAAELSAIPEFALTAERRDPCGRLEGDPVLALDRTEWAHDEDCMSVAQNLAHGVLDNYTHRQLTERTVDAMRGDVRDRMHALVATGALYRDVLDRWIARDAENARRMRAHFDVVRSRMPPQRDLGRAGPLSVQVYEDGVILSGTERERLDWNEAHALHAMLVDAFSGPEYAEVLRRQREKLR